MNKFDEIFEKMVPDRYDRNARLYPMLILLFPVLLSFWAIIPEKMYNWEAIAGLAFWCGLAYILKEMGRDCGKKKEKALWARWGGAPTTQYLRYRNSKNKVTLKRIHDHLNVILPSITMPSSEYEYLHPSEADEVYEECTRVMIQKTRDHKKYPLLFKELCSYGFWRNLWGLKIWGILLSVFSIIAVSVSIFIEWHKSHALASYNSVICGLLVIVLFIFWLTLNEDRIRTRAFAYSERLFEATEPVAKDH
ncbi:MAG: hypothetical protein ACYC54_00110 [Sedimentisphaerales bacterium]